MSGKRRNYRLANKLYKNVDLRAYADLIKETINKTVPNKHPEVFQGHFSTDILTHSEAVKIGRALIQIPELKSYSMMTTQFRLFEGKVEDNLPKHSMMPKGGRKS